MGLRAILILDKRYQVAIWRARDGDKMKGRAARGIPIDPQSVAIYAGKETDVSAVSCVWSVNYSFQDEFLLLVASVISAMTSCLCKSTFRQDTLLRCDTQQYSQNHRVQVTALMLLHYSGGWQEHMCKPPERLCA